MEQLSKILDFIKEKELTAYEIAQLTGLSEPGVRKIINGETKKPNQNTIKQIAEALQNKFYNNRKRQSYNIFDEDHDIGNEVSTLYNEPSKIKTKNGLEFEEMIEGGYLVTVDLIPQEAHSRYISEDVDVCGDWEKVTFKVDRIGRGVYKAFKHKGFSMFNDESPGYYDIQNGDISLCRQLNRHHWKDGFNKNKAPYGWIIITTNNIIHKDIIEFNLDTGDITCQSRNPSPEYQDFKWNLDNVREIFKIITVNHNSKN